MATTGLLAPIVNTHGSLTTDEEAVLHPALCELQIITKKQRSVLPVSCWQPPLSCYRMKDPLILMVHLLTTIAKQLGNRLRR